MSNQENNTNSHLILVVEDDQFLSSLITKKLIKEGYRTTEAADGDTALEEIKEKAPDAILLDLILPGKEGGEILKTLKATPEFESIPVLVLTNLGTEKDVEKLTQMGAADYIIKANFTPAEIVKKIKEVLSN